MNLWIPFGLVVRSLGALFFLSLSNDHWFNAFDAKEQSI